MFKKTRVKIVASITAVLIALFSCTLCVIYITSYTDVYNQNQDMLKRYIETELRKDISGNDVFPKRDFDQPRTKNDRAYSLSTFYSVTFSSDGEILKTDNHNSGVYTDEELKTLAASVNSKDKSDGKIDDLIYRLERYEGYTVVAFMDNTIMSESITTLFQYTLIFGAVAIAVLFLISLLLAKRIVKPVEESYTKQKQFISDAGHELKTPVSVISANAELLSREIGENQWLSNIQFENDRMAVLIKQLMELTKIENVKPQMQKTDFSRVVLGELLAFESVAYEKGAELIYNAVEENVFVNGNPQQLGQVVSILLDNAIEHSQEHSAVTVSLSLKHNKAYLYVTNKGSEISKEQCDLIFERFYRSDYARTGEDNHYGLGLAIAKAIVTSHHGSISVSCGDGMVTFCVCIPA
ncbi:MAG: sensor histidine kinase [Eubacterium sp.]